MQKILSQSVANSHFVVGINQRLLDIGNNSWQGGVKRMEHAILGAARRWSDHYAQSRRLVDADTQARRSAD